MIDLSKIQLGKNFVGRDLEIQDLKRKIRNNGVVVLTGNRGIGKTNLMKVLEKFFKNERECHYIESGSLFSKEMSRYFLPEKVDAGISHSVSAMGFGGGVGRNWSPREETILEGMEKSENMIVFVENAHELRKEDMGIIFAGTGRNNKLKFVLEIARPYYNDADFKITPEQLVELGKLGDGDIGKIVEKECPDFTEKIIKMIVSRSIGYPYVARSLAYICEKKESESEMLDFLNTLKDADMEHTLDRVHKGVLATLDNEAQVLIKKLAIAPSVLTLPLIEAFCGEDADASLGEVIERGILRDDGGKYGIYHPLFRGYLQKSQRISHKNKKNIYSKAMENVKTEFDSVYLLLEVLNKNDIFNELVGITKNYDALNLIGEQSCLRSKLSEATFAWFRLLKLAEENKDAKAISVATGNMGIIYKIQGDMEKALKHHEKALEISEKIGNLQGMASQLGNMGIIYRIQGDMEKALKHHENALEISEKIGNKQGMACDLGNMGDIYQTQGDMEKALEHHEKALKIHQDIGYKQGMANQLGNIGLLFQINGDMEKALEHYDMALEIHEDIGNKGGIANDYGNIGNVFKTSGDIQKAMQHHKMALKIHEDIGDKSGIAHQLGNIGTDYQTQKDMEKALEYYQKALEIFKDIEDKTHQAQTLMNIGLIYINKGEESTALDSYFDAQEIALDYAPQLLKEINRVVNRLLAIQ